MILLYFYILIWTFSASGGDYCLIHYNEKGGFFSVHCNKNKSNIFIAYNELQYLAQSSNTRCNRAIYTRKNRTRLILEEMCRLYGRRRVLCKTRLIFPRINGPNVSSDIQTPQNTDFEVAGYRLKHWMECFDVAVQLKSNSWRNSEEMFAKFYQWQLMCDTKPLLWHWFCFPFKRKMLF